MQFDSDEIRLQGLTHQDLAFVYIRLDPTKVFEHYQCNNEVTVDPNVLALSQALKQREHDSVVKLLVSTDSIIVLTEQEDCVFKCELPVQIADFRDIPNDQYKCILTMPMLKLQQETILHDALPGDRYSISAKDGAVYLTSTNFNDFTVTKRILSSSNQVNVVINDTLPAVTVIPHLLHILLNALMMSSENTTLSVADEIPFKLSQSLTEVTNMQGEAEHVGDLSYFLMPFTTEDAENDVLVMAEEAFSTTREARFKGQLIHGKQFADIIQSLGEDFGQAVVECSSTGLRISGMCNTHISLAEVVLSTKDFSSLECNESFVLGCEFKNFARIMQDVKENDVVGLAIRETIEVSVHSPSDQHELSLKGKYLDCSNTLYWFASN